MARKRAVTVWLAAAIAIHAGARHVLVTDVNDYRLDLAKRLGADLALNVTLEKSHQPEKTLGMKEGFVVGLPQHPATTRVAYDALNHASIIDGARLCKAIRFRHKNCDMADIEAQLMEAGKICKTPIGRQKFLKIRLCHTLKTKTKFLVYR